jgi:hypothetical protein
VHAHHSMIAVTGPAGLPCVVAYCRHVEVRATETLAFAPIPAAPSSQQQQQQPRPSAPGNHPHSAEVENKTAPSHVAAKLGGTAEPPSPVVSPDTVEGQVLPAGTRAHLFPLQPEVAHQRRHDPMLRARPVDRHRRVPPLGPHTACAAARDGGRGRPDASARRWQGILPIAPRIKHAAATARRRSCHCYCPFRPPAGDVGQRRRRPVLGRRGDAGAASLPSMAVRSTCIGGWVTLPVSAATPGFLRGASRFNVRTGPVVLWRDDVLAVADTTNGVVKIMSIVNNYLLDTVGRFGAPSPQPAPRRCCHLPPPRPHASPPQRRQQRARPAPEGQRCRPQAAAAPPCRRCRRREHCRSLPSPPARINRRQWCADAADYCVHRWEPDNIHFGLHIDGVDRRHRGVVGLCIASGASDPCPIVVGFHSGASVTSTGKSAYVASFTCLHR